MQASKNLFQKTLARENDDRPPVWLMRQAGRYHSHYQNLKKAHSFMDLCKRPELACETAMGPVRDFDFDAAILFSDLLFPLEAMGMGLDYAPGPKLGWHLRSRADLCRLKGGAGLAEDLRFQERAMRLIRSELSPSKGLLGFVGGPVTLFSYAVEGSHQGELREAREGLRDGRFEGFVERLLDLLAENMALQARGGADTIAVMDTCAGEFDPGIYREVVVPALRGLLERFERLSPGTPVTYYSKKTGPEHWRALDALPIACLGIDWIHDIAKVLREWSGRYAIQGCFDPEKMTLPRRDLEPLLREWMLRAKSAPTPARRGWICGLGHGVLQTTPEENVRLFVRTARETLCF